MKLRMKILLTVLLAVFAAVSLMAVLTDLGVLDAASPAAADSGYLLRDWDGYVGVFCPPDGAEPVTVTDIRVGDPAVRHPRGRLCPGGAAAGGLRLLTGDALFSSCNLPLQALE